MTTARQSGAVALNNRRLRFVTAGERTSVRAPLALLSMPPTNAEPS
jgi:hypothetical protein